MRRGKWWASDKATNRAQVQNFRDKIAGLQATFGLTAAQITHIQGVCDAYLAAYDFATACDATAEAVTKWRNHIFRGQPTGSAAPDPPVFPVGLPVNATVGVVTQFFAFRDQLVANPAFTEALGEDLGILGPLRTEALESEVAPSLKLSTRNGYTVEIGGSMKGNPQMRVEWRAKGNNKWELVTFLSSLPATVVITPESPGDPETGELRAVYYRKNEQYGLYSPNYPLTITE